MEKSMLHDSETVAELYGPEQSMWTWQKTIETNNSIDKNNNFRLCT